MLGLNDIIGTLEGQLRRNKAGETISGIILVMRDGTRWFHPYSGGPPFQTD